jgi:hypothetical protein
LIHEVANYTQQLWTHSRKTKKSQSGWLSGNAVCCIHNGDNQDTRGRGGLIVNADGGVSWHCFNCGFKTGYQPGRPLSFKYRKFLNWLGADVNEIQRLVVEALRIKDLIQPEDIKPIVEEEITFTARKLPNEALSFMAIAEFYHLADKNFPREFVNAVDYVYQRKIDMQQYEFYWSPEVENKLSHRVIIPFHYKKKIVGYTARTFVDGIQPKYHSDHPSQFVFNLDKQHYDNKFVIVCEGAFDAMAVDGLAVLSNNISEQQAELIEALGKKVIVVPDFDRHGNKQGKQVWPGRQLVKCAIDYGWSVSFPVWAEQVKDIADALVKYGKLFVIKTILEASESNPVKIQLISKKYE